MRDSSAATRVLTRVLLGITALMILGGVVLRARGMTRSLWLDEAVTANSTVQKSLLETLYPPLWVQTSPPGFLILVRATNHIFGLSNISLRIVPFAVGILALILMACIAWSVLRPLAATWVVALCAFSPNAIFYGHSVKPYSLELACSTALLTAAWLYRSDERASRFGLLFGILVVSIVGAYGTALILPGLLLFIWPSGLWPFGHAQAQEGDSSLAVSRWLLVLLASSAIFLTLFFVSVRPNRSKNLVQFMRRPKETSIGAVVDYTEFQLYDLSQEIPVPPPGTRIPSAVRHVLITGVPFCILFGIAFADGDAKKKQFLIFMCGCPLVTAYLLDLMNIYPWHSRTLLLLLPCMALSLGSCLEIVENRINEGIRAPGFAAAICIFVIVVTCAIGLRYGEGDRTDFNEDMAGAIRLLSHKALPSDFIFIEPWAQQSWELYSQVYHLPRYSDAAYGNTAWPCCARGKEPNVSSRALVSQDFLSNLPATFVGNIWILGTARATHWRHSGLDEPAFLASALTSSGCRQIPIESFASVSLQLFSCSATALPKLRGLLMDYVASRQGSALTGHFGAGMRSAVVAANFDDVRILPTTGSERTISLNELSASLIAKELVDSHFLETHAGHG